jgi:tRNA/rRNA methyltransferase
MRNADLRVVLARPQIGENIGFVARLCTNFALDDLWLVAPLPEWHDGARKTGTMCRDLLDRVRVSDDLASALADRERVLGFTARSGEDRDVAALPELGARIRAGERVALLFGNEQSGLSAEETASCEALFRISLPGRASMNVSHAVALALWELCRDGPAPALAHVPHRYATVAEKARLEQEATELLAAAGYKVADPHYHGALQRLLIGRPVEARDLRILHRVVRHLARRVRGPGEIGEKGPGAGEDRAVH